MKNKPPSTDQPEPGALPRLPGPCAFAEGASFHQHSHRPVFSWDVLKHVSTSLVAPLSAPGAGEGHSCLWLVVGEGLARLRGGATQAVGSGRRAHGCVSIR